MADFETYDGDSHRSSIRDSLMAAAEQFREPETSETTTPPAIPAAIAETGAPAEAAQRARDESGKFVSTPAAKAPAAPALTAPAGPAAAPAVASVAPAAAVPSSWKKEHHEAFQKLDPTMQAYINQRENEFKAGVATYRDEALKAQTVTRALEPFMPAMQKYNVQPAQWIESVGRTHEMLLLGSPQQKLQTLMGIARDYGVDLSPLTGGAQGQQPGADGQQQPAAQLNPEMAWMRDQITQLSGTVNTFTQTQQQEAQRRQQEQDAAINHEIQQFAADTTNHPHFQVLWQPMAQLLESGLAQDLQSAYDKALRMNDDLWKAQQAAQVESDKVAQQRAKTEAAAKARAKTVSVAGSTPAAAAGAPSGAQGRRAQLAEAFSSHAGGRV